MASKVKEICESTLAPIINDLGYELVEVEYAKKFNGNNLTFIIDNESGILIEDCEKVHKILDQELDKINPTNDQPYILNVSSPGLDRPIKTKRDFLRNKDKEVEVKLFSPQKNKKVYKGILCNMTDEFVELAVDNETQTFDKKNIAQIVPVIKI